MTTSVFHSFVCKVLSLSWLTGPIFDKELRVSSRRRRNYTLRLIYVILLTFFIAIVWLSLVKSEGSSAYQKSRLALAGKTIVTTIVMFQFFATPGGVSQRAYQQGYPYTRVSTYKPSLIERLLSRVMIKIGKYALRKLFGFEYEPLPKQNLDRQKAVRNHQDTLFLSHNILKLHYTFQHPYKHFQYYSK